MLKVRVVVAMSFVTSIGGSVLFFAVCCKSSFTTS
jgi:hypothetical protein